MVIVRILVVEGNAIRLVFRTGSAGATGELGHLRAGAGATSQISITANRSERGSSGSEVVVRDGLERIVMVGAITTRAEGILAMARARMEGTMGEGSSASVETGNTVISSSWLPVDRLHAVFEVSRGLELPLADDGPEDEDTTNGGSNGCDNYDGGLCDL